jgi:hypothetical protein
MPPRDGDSRRRVFKHTDTMPAVMIIEEVGEHLLAYPVGGVRTVCFDADLGEAEADLRNAPKAVSPW